MTQLPSVSELLIGAQTAKPDTTLQMGVQSVNSGTSPRQIQTQARHDISHALGYLAGPPTKLPRVEPTSHVYTETMAAERLSGSYQGGHQSTHQNSHESSHQSSSSSARNSVTSVTSEGQPQVAHLPSTSDFHNQHKGATRSNNTSSSPQLHYRQRHEPSANIDALSDSVPHASLTQNIPSPDIVSRQREPVTEKRGEPQPYDRSTTTAREHSLGGRPRPASFSFAAGPPPMSGPSVPLYAPMKQSYGHMPNPNPHPDLQPIQGYASAHYHAPPIGPMTFYNAPTAGSGYVHNYYSTPPGQYSVAVPGPVPGMHHGSFHSAYPGTYPGMVPGTYPGAVAGPGYIKHGPYMTPEAALPGNYGHDYYAPAQYRQGQIPVTPYSQVDAMIRQPQHHLPVPDGPPEDLASLSSDPNHALINKRCIIKRRTRTGCLTCRKRRIKCDERKPHCFNCERSKKICLGYEISTNSNSTMTYTLEMKQQNNSSSESLHDNEQSQVKTEKPPVERQRSSVHDLL